MTKQIRDEFVQHHEGQSLFTMRRALFAVMIVSVAVGIATWYFVTESV